MRPLIIYHAACADGFCSAWVAHLALGEAADYVAAAYGDPPPEVRGREVYILDFSYKRPVMVDIINQAERVVVLDHHKTAKAELAGLAEESVSRGAVITFDASQSGASLTWFHFFPSMAPPPIVRYVRDRDLWKWELENSLEINAVISSFPNDFAFWHRTADTWDGEALADQGRVLTRYRDQIVAQHVAAATEVEVAGHRVLAVNATTLQSEVAGKLAEGRPFGAVYIHLPDGRRKWSLRSRDGGVDVSEIAAARGGGGHRNAAGFTE